MQSYSGQPGAQNPSTSAQNMNGLPAQISVVQQPPVSTLLKMDE